MWPCSARTVRPLSSPPTRLLGIVVFVIPRVAMLSALPLSRLYVTISAEPTRQQLVAAGHALSALGVATPQTVGFFFVPWRP
ncbi:MAG: hypothetical protein R3C44_21245 [Chloroflexota bacterium]